MRYLPKPNSKYWAALVAASIFGTNTGDFISDYLHLGHLAGIPVLIAFFAAILLAEKLSPWASALYFWAAIITVRTAATNVGDSFHDYGINFGLSIPIVSLLFIIAVAIYRSGASQNALDMTMDTVRVNGLYWMCMTLAGVFGTLAGDFMSFGVGLGTLGASLAWGAGVAAMLSKGRAGPGASPNRFSTGSRSASSDRQALLPATSSHMTSVWRGAPCSPVWFSSGSSPSSMPLNAGMWRVSSLR